MSELKAKQAIREENQGPSRTKKNKKKKNNKNRAKSP
jgi:hypothetical protein